MYGKDTIIASKLIPNEDEEGNLSPCLLDYFLPKVFYCPSLGVETQLCIDNAPAVSVITRQSQGRSCNPRHCLDLLGADEVMGFAAEVLIQ